MRSDKEIKAEVLGRLDSIPEIAETEITVVVESGQVTLQGQVDDHQTRFHVERVVRKVDGIRELVVQIDAD